MENEHYRVDKIAIAEDRIQRASEAVAVIEKKSEGSPVAFLKSNYDNKKIRERKTDIDFKPTLSAALTKICALAAIKSQISQFDAEDILKMILNSYTDLTLEELYKAFELERYAIYEAKTEHYNLFNADYVSAILKKYKNWKQATKMQHNISRSQQLPEKTDSQKMEIVNNGIIRVFNEYKSTGVMPEPCAHIFDELYERKIIKDATGPKTQAYYQEKYDQAAMEIQRELKTEDVSTPAVMRTIREELEKIAHNNSEKVVVRSKKIILKDFFDSKVKAGESIESIIL